MVWSSKSQETEVRTIGRWVIQVRIPDPAKTTLSAINLVRHLPICRRLDGQSEVIFGW